MLLRSDCDIGLVLPSAPWPCSQAVRSISIKGPRPD